MLNRLDPRTLVLVAVAFSFLLAITQEVSVVAAGLVLGLLGVLVGPQPGGIIVKRFLAVNVFVAALFVTLPFGTPGVPLFEVGRVAYTREGVLACSFIALKTNAIMLVLTATLGSIEVISLGHALSHLRAPYKLIHVFLFTIRYLDVLQREYVRLRNATKLRGYRHRANLHTYTTVGNLLGMLLVRSFDRSDRVLAAMKCRGFKGKFYVLNHFHYSKLDAIFGAVATITFLFLAWASSP